MLVEKIRGRFIFFKKFYVYLKNLHFLRNSLAENRFSEPCTSVQVKVLLSINKVSFCATSTSFL